MKKKELNLQEIQKVSLGILINVADFCEKINITYYLSCGTLLGAVRHKGFIPWDDDVDIMMPRPDYNRFLKEYNDDTYKIILPSLGRNYYAKAYDSRTIKIENGTDYNRIKPTGISIDIFPLDGIVNDEKIIAKLHKRSAFLELLLRLANQPIFYRKNPLKAINRIIPRIIGGKNLVKLIEKNAQTYPYETSDYVIRMRNTPNGFTGALKKDVYNPPRKLEFEGHYFYVPNKYDEWLTRFFGDYMKLPPIEKRQTHHTNKCYYLEFTNE